MTIMLHEDNFVGGALWPNDIISSSIEYQQW